jgi:AraC family transcriptional regulator
MTTSALVAASSRPTPSPAMLGLIEPSWSFAPRSAAGPDATAIALSQLLAEAFEALDHDRDGARLSLSRAVALLDVRPQPEPQREVGDLTPLAPWQAKKALAHIDDHLASTIRIGDLAVLARLSKSYFSRAFKTTFGRSPQRFIVDRRVERAQQVMLTSDEPLCGVALTCGFRDQAQVSRVFRRTVGASPNQWRRARRAAPRPAGSLRPIEV